MTVATEKILHDALALSPIEKAELIENLFMSFSSGVASTGADSAWKTEVEGRVEAYRNGDLSGDSVERVLNRICNP